MHLGPQQPKDSRSVKHLQHKLADPWRYQRAAVGTVLQIWISGNRFSAFQFLFSQFSRSPPASHFGGANGLPRRAYQRRFRPRASSFRLVYRGTSIAAASRRLQFWSEAIRTAFRRRPYPPLLLFHPPFPPLASRALTSYRVYRASRPTRLRESHSQSITGVWPPTSRRTFLLNRVLAIAARCPLGSCLPRLFRFSSVVIFTRRVRKRLII